MGPKEREFTAYSFPPLEGSRLGFWGAAVGADLCWQEKVAHGTDTEEWVCEIETLGHVTRALTKYPPRPSSGQPLAASSVGLQQGVQLGPCLPGWCGGQGGKGHPARRGELPAPKSGDLGLGYHQWAQSHQQVPCSQRSYGRGDSWFFTVPFSSEVVP